MLKSIFQKNITSIIAILICINAAAQTNITHAGKKGIWVLCGTKMPKNFSYRILRQIGREDFKPIAELTSPNAKEKLQGDLIAAQQLAGLPINSVSENRLNLIWQRLNQSVDNELPIEMVSDYPMREAVGTAFFDAVTDSAVSYTYKVQMIGNKNEMLSEVTSYQSSWPGKAPQPQILPLNVRSINTSIVGQFAIIDRERMVTCKVYRSYYLRSGFEEIQGEPIFTQNDSIPVIEFTDKTATGKVPYTYAILPIDAAGNEGALSPELKLFNVADKTIIPSVTNFQTTSVEDKNAIKLSWSLKDTKNMISIDIFKGDKYDGKYIKIATIPGTDTTYFDGAVSPIETYFYTVRLNSTYEKSPMSARTPGILKASRLNLFPPQNLRLVQEKNMVHLSWKKNEDDTRAYYVYRSTKRDNVMQQVGKLIITDSATISYTDTVPQTIEPGMYAYAIADQNTSYAISSLTPPVYAYFQGINATPIPHDLNVSELPQKHVQLLWANMQKESNYVANYGVYRRGRSLDSTKTENLRKIATLPPSQNSYIDTTAKPNMVYYYSIKTIGDQGTESSPSLESGYRYTTADVNNVANVRLFSTEGKVLIKWDNPVSTNIKNITLSRMNEGDKNATFRINLTADQQEYNDDKITKGSTYYYQIQVEDKDGNLSRITDPVGVKIY